MIDYKKKIMEQVAALSEVKKKKNAHLFTLRNRQLEAVKDAVDEATPHIESLSGIKVDGQSLSVKWNLAESAFHLMTPPPTDSFTNCHSMVFRIQVTTESCEMTEQGDNWRVVYKVTSCYPNHGGLSYDVGNLMSNLCQDLASIIAR